MTETKSAQKARLQSMTPVELLRVIIAEDFHCSLDDGKFLIEEESSGQPHGVVRFGGRRDILGIDIDQNKDGLLDFTLPFLSTRLKQLTKACDLVLFVPHQKNRILVLLFEMKSYNNGEYLRQLRAGRELIRFVSELVHLYFDIKLELDFCGILMRYPSQKGTTQADITPFTFQDRNSLLVCEINRQTDVQLNLLVKAATRDVAAIGGSV